MYVILDVNGVQLFEEQFATQVSAIEFALQFLPFDTDFEVKGEEQGLGLSHIAAGETANNVISLCDFRRAPTKVRYGN